MYSEYPLLRVSKVTFAYPCTPRLFTHCTLCRKKTPHRQRMAHHLNTRSPPYTPIHTIVLRKVPLHPMTLNAFVRRSYALSAQKRSKLTMTQHNDQPTTSPVFPANGCAAIYARVAPGARTQTTNPQTRTLIELANEQGYPNERIIVYEDVGVSARRPIAKRGALSNLLTAITEQEEEKEPGKIQTVYASSINRLFRDPTVIDIATFVRVCAKHGVQLVTPEISYNFQDLAHVALFRFQCESSYQFMRQQVRQLTRRTRHGR